MSAAVRVQVLKLRAASDTLAARHRIEMLLAATDVAPTSLPPTATLYVRRLVDPRPGEIDVGGTALRPPRAWEDAVTSALERSLRTAARPAHQSVPPSADAVLFADESERLAALVGDWARGLVSTRWWWQLDADSTSLAKIVGSLRRLPAHVPAVMNGLAAESIVVPFLRSMNLADAGDLCRSVLVTFGHAELTALLPAVQRMAATPESTPARSNYVFYRPSPDAAELYGSERVEPPWASWAPEALVLADLPLQQFLLGVTLGQHRAASLTRTQAFAAAVARWAGVQQTPELTMSAGSSPSQARWRPEQTAAEDSDTRVPSIRSTSHPERGLPRTEPSEPIMEQVRARDPAMRTPGRPDPLLAYTEIPSQPPVRESAATHIVPTATDILAKSTSDAGLDEPATDLQLAPTPTSFGGVFYLMNVALTLGLYTDFTEPNRRPIELDPWEFLSLVARRLLADEAEKDDPLWRLLDHLADRPRGTVVGHGFTSPSDWQIDPAWLEPFRDDSRPWRWSVTPSGRRLVVVHPAGFRIIDMAIGARRPDVAVPRALAPYEPHPRLRQIGRPPRRRRPRPVDRWIENVSQYIAERITLALGASAPRAPIARVLRQRADVFVTNSSVDVYLELDSLPIAVRMAGLDRDPGWIPAARRDIRFHYR